MNYRSRLLRLFTFLGGIYFFLEFVLPESFSLAWLGAPDTNITFGKFTPQISNGFITVGAMAIGLGLYNLLSIHGAKVAFRRKGWINSVALLVGLAAMMIVTSRDWAGSRQVASDTEQLVMLRNFTQAIAADEESKAPVPPVITRNAALLSALEKTVSEVRERVTSQLSTLAQDGLSPDTPQHRVLATANAELQVALTSVAQLQVALAADPASTSRHVELATALSQAAVAYRQILSTAYEQSLTKKVYNFFFIGIFSSLGTAMFSLLGFYIASAAYRAFRVRSTESALMIIAALIVMLGQIPFGMWIWEGFPELRLWILNTPSAGARRAIEIGAAVAGLVMAFRMWLSIESESFSEPKK